MLEASYLSEGKQEAIASSANCYCWIPAFLLQLEETLEIRVVQPSYFPDEKADPKRLNNLCIKTGIFVAQCLFPTLNVAWKNHYLFENSGSLA